MSETQECSICKVVLPLDAFALNAGRKNGRLNQCKKCCAEKARARYQLKLQRKARPFCDVENEVKTCITCLDLLPFEAFYKKKTGQGGLRADCIECYAKYLKKNNLRSKFGLTLQQYEIMLAKQGNACAICGQFSERPHVDHCHKTGRIRALLCVNCNLGLGNFQDNTEYLSRAIAYLKRHKSHQLCF